MADSASETSGIADRYATALFELAREADAFAAIEADTGALAAALKASADLRLLISSPIYSRDEQARAIAALGDALGLQTLTKNLLGLMAEKRRLFVLPRLLYRFADLLAAERGELRAEVTAARALSDAQAAALGASIAKALGREVKLDVTVDDTLIGGLIVKVGSKMIDTSIRSRLAALKTAMKEVG